MATAKLFIRSDKCSIFESPNIHLDNRLKTFHWQNADLKYDRRQTAWRVVHHNTVTTVYKLQKLDRADI